ncbi:MAG: sulfatase-like hydrolase/transferase [Calditrichaeota bacterium]|nr:sulfatase-like hydrolase/transferase [Calditrichota bacterium]
MSHHKKIALAQIWAVLSALVLGVANSIYIISSSPHLFWNILDRISFIAFSILLYLFFGGIVGLVITLFPAKKLFKLDGFDKLSSLHISVFFSFVIGFWFVAEFIKFSLFGTRLIRNLSVLLGTAFAMFFVAWLLYCFLTKMLIGKKLDKIVLSLINKNVFGAIVLFSFVLVFVNVIINGYIINPKFSNAKKPNIILISLDTLSARHVSCLGYERLTTPNIDEFAKSGVLFENATSQAKWTLPSHTSIFTSVVPTAHQVNDAEKKLSAPFVTLAEMLGSNGYYCGAFVDGAYGSWIGAIHGLDQGFSFYEHYPDQFNKYEKLFIISHAKNFILDYFARHFKYPYMHSKIISKNVIGWLKHFHKQQPFFLFLHYYDIHADYFTEVPYISPHPYDTMFSSGYMPNFRKLNPNRLGGARLLRELYKRIEAGEKVSDVLSVDDLNFFISRYDGGIRYVDDQIGMLFDGLKKIGVFDKTLIIITADHGEEFLEHQKFLHGQFYEEIVHVPLIMYYPNLLPQNIKVRKQARSIDIAPTIADILGLKKLDQFQGQSLLPYLEKPDEDMDLIAFGGQDKPKDTYCFIKRGNLKVIFHSEARFLDTLKGGEPIELYFIDDDPFEKINRAEENKELVQNFSLLKDKWIKESLDLRRRIGAGKSKGVKVDKNTIEKLKALGYIK